MLYVLYGVQSSVTNIFSINVLVFGMDSLENLLILCNKQSFIHSDVFQSYFLAQLGQCLAPVEYLIRSQLSFCAKKYVDVRAVVHYEIKLVNLRNEKTHAMNDLTHHLPLGFKSGKTQSGVNVTVN